MCAGSQSKILPQGNILDTVFAGDASPTWRSIEYGLELLKAGVVHRVGNGVSINIWRDNWLPRRTAMKPVGSTRWCRLRKVCHLIDRRSGQWDEAVVRRYFYPWDVEEILKIKLPRRDTEDVIAWHYEKTGVFSVRSAYRLAMQLDRELGHQGSSTAPDGERAVWRKLWRLAVPPKVRVFAWKAIQNGLPTRANRHYRHLDQQSTCQICGMGSEDVFHAVITCPHAAGPAACHEKMLGAAEGG